MGMAGLGVPAGLVLASGGNTPSALDGASPDHAGVAIVAITSRAIPQTTVVRMTRFPFSTPT